MRQGVTFAGVMFFNTLSDPPLVFDYLRVRRSTYTLVTEGSGLTLVGERGAAGEITEITIFSGCTHLH